MPNVRLGSFLSKVNFNSFWEYSGSLTRPPCSEGVKWIVIKSAQPVSDMQLISLTQWFSNNPDFADGKGNNREIQPLNTR